jgi:type VI secretion system protein ImpF
MSQRHIKERLQPCLLDRINDDSSALEKAKVRVESLRKRLDGLGSDDRAREGVTDRLREESVLMNDLNERVNRSTITEQQLRQSIMRDLAWLLSTPGLECVENLAEFPEVQASTINYGVRGLAGWTASQIAPSKLAAMVREAILRFEPRILPNNLRIEVSSRGLSDERTVMAIEIRGEMWGQPLPQSLYLRSLLDLETGDVRIMPAGGS